MAAGAPQTFRIPLALLAAANLAVLGVVLWPWPDALNLPVGGSAAFDPAVTLCAYLGLIFWTTSGIEESTQEALSQGAILGLAAGGFLVVRVLVAIRVAEQPGFLQPALVTVAVILWGVAGLRGSRPAGSVGMGALSGLWSSMVSCLLASAAILAELYLAGPTQASPDPWKQYQGLAIGNPATQGLVHSLDSATAFLLLGPLAGTVVGLIFAFFAWSRKN